MDEVNGWPIRANEHYWARGWGHYNVTCPMCNYVYQAVAAVGTVCMAECPCCRHQWETEWEAMLGEGPAPGDGVWL